MITINTKNYKKIKWFTIISFIVIIIVIIILQLISLNKNSQTESIEIKKEKILIKENIQNNEIANSQEIKLIDSISNMILLMIGLSVTFIVISKILNNIRDMI